MDVNLLISGSPPSPLGWMAGAPQPSWVLWGGKSLVGVAGAWPDVPVPCSTLVCVRLCLVSSVRASVACFLRACRSGTFPPFLCLWPVFSVRAAVAHFLRSCICGLFSPCVPLWRVSSVHASVAFPPSVCQWRFFHPCICGVFSMCASVALFLPPCVCGAFLRCVRLWSVSSVHASVVFSPSVDLWRFLCESVACFLRPRWRPSLLSSHHLLIAPCVLSLCQACGVCHLCGRVLRDTQGHTLGELQWWGHSHAAQPSVWGSWCPPSSSRSSLGADPSSAFSPRGTSWSKLSKSKVGNGCEMRSGFRCVWSFLFTCLLHIPQMIYFPAGITINYQPLLVQNSMKDIWGGHSLKNMLDFHSCDLHDKAVRTVTLLYYFYF